MGNIFIDAMAKEFLLQHMLMEFEYPTDKYCM